MIVSLNPATEEQLARFEPYSEAVVDAALSDAVRAQKLWARKPVQERVELLRKLAKQLRAGKDAYSRLITAEMGKPLSEAEAEIEKCAWNCEFYADNAPAFLADESVASNASESGIVYDPLGIVLAIMPWNYPFWQFFRFAAPALAAGNAIVLKHANNVPQCALSFDKILKDAGCPDGLYRTLLVMSDKVSGLIADPRIAAITLTGSTEVGSIVASQAGKVLKKQVLELGGSDPFIVLPDADLELAAAAAVKARFTNSGQSCINSKRFLVDASVADKFVELFCANTAKLVVGDPTRPDTAIGPLARGNLRDTLHDQVQRTVAKGGVVKLGGKPLDGAGFFYPPTIIDNVTPDMAAFVEETFGPVATITRVAGVDEAITLANQTEFGLGAAIWTKDIAKARTLARQIEAGAVFINGIVASDPRLPFGGIKQSGYGRELGIIGMREFVNIKTLWIGPAQA